MNSARLSGKSYLKGMMGIFALVLSARNPVAGPAYPVRLAPGQHYLVDQNNTPYFIQGDSAWSLIANVQAGDADYYLSNRCSYGFNSVIVNLIEKRYATNAPLNAYGVRPFTNHLSSINADGNNWDFSSVNPDYFTNADYVINRAAHYGIQVFLFPAYLGYGGTGFDGWYPDMKGSGSNAVFAYGQYVGNRYKNFTNIVWCQGGDYSAADVNIVNALANGIASVDSNHIQTAHGARPVNSMDYYTGSWDVLNGVYPPDPTDQQSIQAYQRVPVAPMFLIEPFYENRVVGHYRNGKPASACRQSAWDNVFSGSTGHFFGNENVWSFGYETTNDWKGNLASTGAATITNVIRLMNTRPWFACIPDINHKTVTSGYGTIGKMNCIACTRESTGKTLMVYIPVGSMTPTVNMTKISGSSANAWWYNPRTGAATTIGTFYTSGTKTFTPPDTNDWILVLDDASQNYGPPGGGSAPQTPVISVDPTNQNTSDGANASLGL